MALLFSVGLVLAGNAFAGPENNKNFVTQTELDSAINAIELTPGPQGPAGPAGATGPTGTFPAGTAIGDMQYWNGTAWVMIPVGDHNTTLRNCDGVPTWVVASCPSIQLGDTGPAGGIVFYITDAGAHGLEAAPVDHIDAPWGCVGTVITGADGFAVGTGAQNTADILEGCNEAGIAARIAADYSLNGFDDWYLPSKDELNQLHINRDVVGGFADGLYWSSTEDNSYRAWFQNVFSGYQGRFTKDRTLRVRAVRAF